MSNTPRPKVGEAWIGKQTASATQRGRLVTILVVSGNEVWVEGHKTKRRSRMRMPTLLECYEKYSEGKPVQPAAPKPEPPTEELLTTIQAAELLGTKRHVILGMVYNKKMFPHRKENKPRGAYYFKWDEVQRVADMRGGKVQKLKQVTVKPVSDAPAQETAPPPPAIAPVPPKPVKRGLWARLFGLLSF